MRASFKGHTEVVKMLLERKGIKINTKSVYLILSMFHSII